MRASIGQLNAFACRDMGVKPMQLAQPQSGICDDRLNKIT
jgi:hypothetical protein